MRRTNIVLHHSYRGSLPANGDKEDAERWAFESFKVLLQDAFSTADSEYELVSADDIRRRARGDTGS
jgi:hypothetical protein